MDSRPDSVESVARTMSYRIEGLGPRFPNGHYVVVEKAADAVTTLATVEKLCGHATAFDAAGRRLTLSDLQKLMQGEIAQRS